MTREYLGETLIDIKKDPNFKDFTAQDWAMKYIELYGGFGGSHHKAWVLDQVSRILKGTPIILKLAKWSDGLQEYRFETGEPSPEYLQWVQLMLGEKDENGEYEYDYDEGIAP